MIEVLMLGREHGWSRLEQAVGQALELGCFDVDAVGLLARTAAMGARKISEPVEIGALSRYDRPQPEMKDYDRLLQELPLTEVMQ